MRDRPCFAHDGRRAEFSDVDKLYSWRQRKVKDKHVKVITSQQFKCQVQDKCGLTDSLCFYIDGRNADWTGSIHYVRPLPLNQIHNMLTLLSIGNSPCHLKCESVMAFGSPEYDYWYKLGEICGFGAAVTFDPCLYLECERLEAMIGPLLLFAMMVSRDIELYVHERQLVVSIDHHDELTILARSASDHRELLDMFWYEDVDDR